MIVKLKKELNYGGVYYPASSKVDIDDAEVLDFLAENGAIDASEANLIDDMVELELLTLRTLKKKAKDLGVEYPRKVTKEELIDLLLEAIENETR
jgi:hypothetical protein